MYDRDLEGETLTFGVSGKLWKNALIMYDRQTDSLWSHLTGEAVLGPLKGQRLKTYPAAMLRYSEWKHLYPETLVLKKERLGMGGMLSGGSRDPYEGYYYSSQTGVIPQKYRDNRLHPKTLVVGLALDALEKKRKRVAKAYPFDELNRAGIINDHLAGREILVTYCEGSGVVFERVLKGEALKFSLATGSGEKGTAACRIMKDEKTGSRWQRLTGLAVEGPLKGEKLRQIVSTLVFWFGWKDYYPESRIYRHPK